MSGESSVSDLPEPYYDDGRVTLYCADCRDVLPFLDHAAAVITDPPYNVGLDYGEGTNDARSDYAVWCDEWFGECRRIARTVAISPGISNIGRWYGRGDDPNWVVAWQKPDGRGRCHIGFNRWEPILVWGPVAQRTQDTIYAPIQPLDVEAGGHPCPKPMKWATGLLSMLTRSGDAIIDPFCGSGTTLRAARDMGRRYVGVEIDPGYCEIAVRRLDQGALDFGRAA